MKKLTILMGLICAILTMPAYSNGMEGDPERVRGWVVVYQTDTSGATVRGSLEKLVKAVKNGGDVKIATNGATSYRTCDHVSIFTIATDEHVGCEVNTLAALVNTLNPLTLRPTPYQTYSWFDTFGNYGIARSSIYGGTNLGQTVLNNFYDVTWFARVR